MPLSLKSRPTDHEFELAVSRVLLVGVVLSAAIVVVGAVLYLLRHQVAPDYSHFHDTANADFFRAAFLSARHGSASGIIQIGLLVLIATPVARVALCIGGFALQRDRLYTFISVLVLAILLFSFLHSGV